MKLPSVKYKTTQPMGSHDIAAVGRVASAVGQQGRVIQQGMSAMASVTADFIKRKQDAEYNDQITSMAIEMNDFTARHAAKQFYDSDELNSLPNDVIRLTDTTTDDSGNEISTPRNAIPAHEVYPHLLQAKLQGIINNKADKISNKDLRNEFIRKADLNGSNMMMNAAVSAEESQQAYKAAVDDAGYKAAADKGDIDAAKFIIENSEASELDKQAMVKNADNRVAVNWLHTSIRSNDPEVVMEARQMLLDPTLSNDLTEAQRQAGLGDLDARLNVLTLGWGDEKDRQADIGYSNFIMATSKGDMTHEDIEARHKIWVDDPQAEGGFDIQQRERAHSVRNSYDNGQAEDARRALAEQRRIEREQRRIAGEEDAEARAAAVALRADEKRENDIYYHNAIKMAESGGMNLLDVEREKVNYEASVDAGKIDPYSLNPKQATNVRRIIQKGQVKAMELAIEVEGGRMMVKEGARSNPGNPDHQKRIDAYVEANNITDMQELVNIASTTSILPQPLEDIISHGALNLDAQSAQQSLLAYGALKDRNESSLLELGPSSRDFMEDAWAYHRVGGDPVKAFELAQINKEIPIEIQERYADMYRTEKYTADNAGWLTGQMAGDEEGRYPYDPTMMPIDAYGPPTRMQIGFDLAVATNFQRHGNIAMARNQAWELMHETWAPSGVGMRVNGDEAVTGAEVKQRGVEQVLGIDTDTGQWRLNAFAEFYNIDPDQIVLQSDSITARDNSTWQVWIFDNEAGYSKKQSGEFPGTELRFNGVRWADEGVQMRYRTLAAKEAGKETMYEKNQRIRRENLGG